MNVNVNLMKGFFDLSQLAVSIMTDQIYYEKYMRFWNIQMVL